MYANAKRDGTIGVRLITAVTSHRPSIQTVETGVETLVVAALAWLGKQGVSASG